MCAATASILFQNILITPKGNLLPISHSSPIVLCTIDLGLAIKLKMISKLQAQGEWMI